MGRFDKIGGTVRSAVDSAELSQLDHFLRLDRRYLAFEHPRVRLSHTEDEERRDAAKYRVRDFTFQLAYPLVRYGQAELEFAALRQYHVERRRLEVLKLIDVEVIGYPFVALNFRAPECCLLEFRN